jgi:hypothetical protein
VDHRPPHDGNILENYRVDTVIVYHGGGVMIRGDRESSFENRLYNVNNIMSTTWRVPNSMNGGSRQVVFGGKLSLVGSCLWWEMLMRPCGESSPYPQRQRRGWGHLQVNMLIDHRWWWG